MKFASKIAYGNENCSVHITNPWITNIQNGFGLFLAQSMDCSSVITVDCLPDSYLINRVKKFLKFCLNFEFYI